MFGYSTALGYSALCSPSKPPVKQRILLAAGFLLFCYALLTWRAVLLNSAAPLLSERRFLALLVGSGVFWLAIGQFDRAQRVTLARVASWIVGGTIIVLIARLTVDWWRPHELLTPSYSVRWSLAWGGYFGLWLAGAITLRQSRPLTWAPERAPTHAEVEWVIAALRAELEDASPAERVLAADRLIAKSGTYEMLEDGDPLAAAHNARLRLAREVAERLY